MACYTVKRHLRSLGGKTFSVRETTRKAPQNSKAAYSERQRVSRLAKKARDRAFKIQGVRSEAISKRRY